MKTNTLLNNREFCQSNGQVFVPNYIEENKTTRKPVKILQSVGQVSLPHYLLDFIYHYKPHDKTTTQYIEFLVEGYINSKSLFDLVDDYEKHQNHLKNLIYEKFENTSSIFMQQSLGMYFGITQELYVPLFLVDMVEKINGDSYYCIDNYIAAILFFYERQTYEN